MFRVLTHTRTHFRNFAWCSLITELLQFRWMCLSSTENTHFKPSSEEKCHYQILHILHASFLFSIQRPSKSKGLHFRATTPPAARTYSLPSAGEVGSEGTLQLRSSPTRLSYQSRLLGESLKHLSILRRERSLATTQRIRSSDGTYQRSVLVACCAIHLPRLVCGSFTSMSCFRLLD